MAPVIICGDEVATRHLNLYFPPPSYTLNAAGEGSAGLASNPEVRAAAGGAGGAGGTAAAAVGAAQQEALRTLSARLKDAYNGVEVHWQDNDAKGSGLYLHAFISCFP